MIVISEELRAQYWVWGMPSFPATLSSCFVSQQLAGRRAKIFALHMLGKLEQPSSLHQDRTACCNGEACEPKRPGRRQPFRRRRRWDTCAAATECYPGDQLLSMMTLAAWILDVKNFKRFNDACGCGLSIGGIGTSSGGWIDSRSPFSISSLSLSTFSQILTIYILAAYMSVS